MDQRAPLGSGRGGGGPLLSAASGIGESVIRVLGELGVPYETIECDPDYADTAAFCARYGYSPDECGNTIIVASKKQPRQHSACVVKGSTRLDVNRTVRMLMGVSRLSFASSDETTAVTGMLIGGVTVFALPEGLPIYVDSKVMDLDTVILGSGSRSSKIRVSPAIFSRIANTEIVDGLSLEPSPQVR